MFKKRKWLVIGVAVAVVILIGGILGGVVYAQSGSTTTTTTTTTNPQDTLMAKVASILGIDQTTLENAFTQAKKDVQSDNLSNYLQSLVTAGKITQDQADQYLQWWNSQPALPNGVNVPGFGMGRMGFGGGFRGMRGCVPPALETTPSTTTEQ